MAKRALPLRWSLRSNSPTTYALKRGGYTYAIAQQKDATRDRWFWYAPGPINTANTPATLDAVKLEARNYISRHPNARPF